MTKKCFYCGDGIKEGDEIRNTDENIFCSNSCLESYEEEYDNGEL